MMLNSNLGRAGAALVLLCLAACGPSKTETDAPTVSSTVPAKAATGVPLNASVTVTFSEAMLDSSITSTTFALKQGAAAVAGAVTYTGVTATFKPAAPLAANTLFTATISTGSKSLLGKALAEDYSWTFTTGAAMDTSAPTVSSTVPVDAAVGVALSGNVAVAFSEPMDALSITSETFLLKQGSTTVPGLVIYAGLTATFTPTAVLAANTVYTATLTKAAKDLAGNALASDSVWSFTTGLAVDITAPVVSSTIPLQSATDIALGGNIAAIFSEPMASASISTSSFTLKQGTTAVVGTVTYVGVTATFNPGAALSANLPYTATITTGARDLAGNALASAVSWTFTTGSLPDTTLPTVSATVPLNSATGVSLGGNLAVVFSEPMAPASVSTVTFTLHQGATAVAGAVTYSGVTATYNPTTALTANTVYTATITTGAKDLAGNALADAFSWTFTTGATPDTTRPTISSSAPVDAATGVALGGNLAATFSEPMDPLTVTSTSFTLKQGATAIAGAVTYSGVTATFNPTNALAANTAFTATITTGAKDLAGNALATAFSWNFTTGATADTTRPTVNVTAPLNNATLVSVGANVTATFSEAMDPLSLTSSTFTLKQGTQSIVGAVTYSGVTAAFNPSSPLVATTLYTATITTGAKDLAGNTIANASTWSFTTGRAPAQPVNLRTAGNYAILAETQISTVPASAITGDIAVSPAAATFITGFSLTIDSSNTFSLSTQVTGRVYAADYTSPTSSNLTTAIADMGTAFTDAAGRAPDFTELGAGDISGRTLAPGVYQWGTGLLVSTDVHLTGNATDVWIFEIAQDLTVSNGTSITLSGGALPKNVFWQVAGAVSLGTTAHLEGVVLCQTAINLGTGASVNGRLLAQTAVNIDGSTVVAPAP